MSLIPQKSFRNEKLSEQNIRDLTASLQESFEVDEINAIDGFIEFKLSRHVNRMKWIDGGNIKLNKLNNDEYQIDYSLDYYQSTVISSMVLLLVALGVFGSNASLLIKIITPVALSALIILFSKLTFYVFEARIGIVMNNIISTNLVFSEEQKEWIDNSSLCPACGHKDVEDLSQCPDCGIVLR